MTRARLRGEVKILPLSKVKPNDWNPNELTPELKESLKHGLIEDGWLVSQALLVWGSDESGEAMDIIIDGEHRWRAAVDLKMKEGPMVVLEGLREADAKDLTIKLNQKRGRWNEALLGQLLKTIDASRDERPAAISFGFTKERFASLLEDKPVSLPNEDATYTPPTRNPRAPKEERSSASPGGDSSTKRVVQVFLEDTEHAAFTADIEALAGAWGTKSVTETIKRAVAFAAESEVG